MARRGRRTEWFSQVGAFNLGSSTGVATFGLISEAELAAYTKPTITRIVGTISLRIAQTVGATPVTAINLLRMGIICQPNSASNNPNDNPDDGWMWTKQRILYRSTPLYTMTYWNGTAAVDVSKRASNDMITVDNIDVDTRIQRICRTGDELNLVVHNTEISDGNQNPVAYVFLRVLVKE